MILKFGTKLDSDRFYCVIKNSHILLISLFICSFSFSPMDISVTESSAPIRASVLKFCVPLQVGKVYCVNKIKRLILIFPSFFNFSFLPSVSLL